MNYGDIPRLGPKSHRSRPAPEPKREHDDVKIDVAFYEMLARVVADHERRKRNKKD